MRKTTAVLIGMCVLISLFCAVASAVDTPYKDMTKDRLWKLPEFQSYKLIVRTNAKIDSSVYKDKTDFELYGVFLKSAEPIVERDASEIGDAKYTYTFIVDKTKIDNAVTACEILNSHENVISADGFVMSMYGYGDINGDNSVDQFDYILAKRIYFETYTPSDLELGFADMDFDGEITIYDCILVSRTYFGTFQPYSANE